MHFLCFCVFVIVYVCCVCVCWRLSTGVRRPLGNVLLNHKWTITEMVGWDSEDPSYWSSFSCLLFSKSNVNRQRCGAWVTWSNHVGGIFPASVYEIHDELCKTEACGSAGRFRAVRTTDSTVSSQKPLWGHRLLVILTVCCGCQVLWVWMLYYIKYISCI